MFKKIVTWINHEFQSIFDAIKPSADVAYKVVNVIKDAVNSPLADAVVDYTNTTVDNVILAQLRKYVPIVAQELLIVENALHAGANENEILAAFIAQLKAQNKDVRAAFYISFAGKLNAAMSDGKIDFTEGVCLGGMILKEMTAKK